jgi:hypothetical protein
MEETPKNGKARGNGWTAGQAETARVTRRTLLGGAVAVGAAAAGATSARALATPARALATSALPLATPARALATPVLDAGPGQPPIIAREVWSGGARPASPPAYGTIELAFVHHTVNANGYSPAEVPALLRSIFSYHIQRGFGDVGYNFIVDRFGGIWEGRAGGIDMPVVGAQAGAYNTESTGVAMLGDFMNVVPSRAAIASLERLLAWKLSLHGVPPRGRATVVVDPRDAFYTPFAPGAHVSLPRIAGHRQGDSTDCPGNALYGLLPSIRPRVASLAGTAARLTAHVRLGGHAPGLAGRAGRAVTVSGRLALLGGESLAGAQVELQQLRAGAAPATLATVQTAPDGSWSVPLTVTRNLLLRGLHRAHPAAVSDPVAVSLPRRRAHRSG